VRGVDAAGGLDRERIGVSTVQRFDRSVMVARYEALDRSILGR
jgi:hypothetical protein